MVNSLLHEWVGRLSVTGKTKIGLLLEKNKKLVFLLDTPPGADPLSLPPLTAGRGFHVAASWASSGASWVRTSDQAGDCCAGAHGKNVAPTQGRDPNHARLIQYICGSLNVLRPAPVGARCQPGWVSVALRFERAYDTLVTPFQLVSSSFPARFQLVSSSFVARFQLSSSSVAFPVGNR